MLEQVSAQEESYCVSLVFTVVTPVLNVHVILQLIIIFSCVLYIFSSTPNLQDLLKKNKLRRRQSAPSLISNSPRLRRLVTLTMEVVRVFGFDLNVEDCSVIDM